MEAKWQTPLKVLKLALYLVCCDKLQFGSWREGLIACISREGINYLKSRKRNKIQDAETAGNGSY